MRVKKVYQKILGPAGWYGPPEMKNGGIRVMFNRSTIWPNGIEPPDRGCRDTRKLGFWAYDDVNTIGQLVLCSQLFTWRPPYKLDGLRCDHDIGAFAFQNWMQPAGTYLHEFTHFEHLMIPAVGIRMIDWMGSPDFLPVSGYGSYNSMMLNKIRKVGYINADSYAWFVDMKIECGRPSLTFAGLP
jgi:hypothetical protein